MTYDIFSLDPIVLCACGCGEKVNPGKRFIRNHYGRVNRDWIKMGHRSNIGRPCSEEKKKKISKSLMGHEVTEETRKKCSESGKLSYASGLRIHPMLGKTGSLSPNYGKKHPEMTKRFSGKANPFYGRKHTKEFKDKMRKITMKRFEDPSNHPMYRKLGKLNPNYGKHLSEESKRKMSLAAGGTGIPYELSEYGVEFDNALKEQVRFRDKYKCQFCDSSQLENKRQLDCHHIDYNKKHNELSNLIALCRSCHHKTNFNRDYWKEYFKSYMKKKKEYKNDTR